MVERFEKATAQRDFATICDQLFATSTRRDAGGSDCASVLAERARSVRRPHIRIRAIEIQGDRAAVRVTTSAAGQASVPDVIQLVREQGGYRVLSLGR